MEPMDQYAERRARELHAQGVPASEAIDMMVRESEEQARELRDKYQYHMPMEPIPRWMAQDAVALIYGER